MKGKLLIYTLLFTLAAVWFTSCNSDDDSSTPTDESDEYSVKVNSFSLEANSDVLENLDSVYFSIDLNGARIYNADSLPKGTDVSKLVVSIGLPSVSAANITMTSAYTGTDTVVDYLSNSTEAINFSNGSVKLHLVSSNGLVNRDYSISVNVHSMNPDSLYWDELAVRSLPGSESPVQQRTVDVDGNILCFVSDGSTVTRSSSLNPWFDYWSTDRIALPDGALLGSLTAIGSELFVLDNTDNLYKSSDMGWSWNDTGVSMTHIYGGYQSDSGNTLLGVCVDNGRYLHITYPETVRTEVPDGCPVTGTSQALVFSTQWSVDPMLMVLGGRTSTGEYSGDMWSFDGRGWSCTTVNGLPGAEGMILIPYYSFKTGNNWIVTQYTTLIAFGGISSTGENQNTVYISRDRGVHWSKGDTYVQLPDYMPAMSYADAFVVDMELPASDIPPWNAQTSRSLPSWCWVTDFSFETRATAPITQWDCPYIYLFGGYDSSGNLYNTIWRGVINRLSFKPLQ